MKPHRNVEYLMEEHGTRLIDIEDLRAVVRDQKRALASSDDVSGSGERLDGNIVRTAFGNAAADIGETHPSFFDVMADEITRLAAPTTEAPPKDAPKRQRIDWSNVVVDEGDEAP